MGPLSAPSTRMAIHQRAASAQVAQMQPQIGSNQWMTHCCERTNKQPHCLLDCFGFFCGCPTPCCTCVPCLVCKAYEQAKLGTFWEIFFKECCCWCICAVINRQNFAHRFGIEENGVMSCCMVWCCGCCHQYQVIQEAEKRLNVQYGLCCQSTNSPIQPMPQMQVVATVQVPQGYPAAPGVVQTPYPSAPPAAPPAAPPPSGGWIEHRDPNSGKPYWHNAATGATTWERPKNWQEYTDASSGKKYWHDPASGETTWTKP